MTVAFTFLSKVYTCDVFIDAATDPCYIFAVILDPELIRLFGEELTIKTDFENPLQYNNDDGQVIALKQAVFCSARELPEFTSAKQRLLRHRTARKIMD